MKNLKKQKLFVLLSLIVFGLASCLPDPISIELPAHESKLVLHARVVPDRFMTTIVSQTFDALDFNEEEEDSLGEDLINQLLLQHARVTVAYANNIDTLFQVTAGVYVSLNTLQITGEEYVLTVYDSTTGRSAIAYNTMLPVVPLDSFSVNYEANDQGGLNARIDIAFTDPNEDNWYTLNVYKRADTTQVDSLDFDNIFDQGQNVEVFKFTLTDDELTAGEQTSGSFTIENVMPGEQFAVTFSNISQSYFDYLAVRSNSQNLIAILTKEPINYPTNVEGGYGFLLTHNPVIKIFTAPADSL